MKPNQMKPARIYQRIAHTIDNIGGRDLPHLAVHGQDARAATNMKEKNDHIDRMLGHTKEAVQQMGMLSEAIKIMPQVSKEAQRLKDVQDQSDGLLNQPTKMANSNHKPAVIMPVKKSPGLSKFATKNKLMSKAMGK